MAVFCAGARRGAAVKAPTQQSPPLLPRQCSTARPLQVAYKNARCRRLRIERRYRPVSCGSSHVGYFFAGDTPASTVINFAAILAMPENDRGCSQKRTANKEREIGQKQWQQHQGEAAKHRCPILHPFAIGKDNETERAENHATDAVRRK